MQSSIPLHTSKELTQNSTLDWKCSTCSYIYSQPELAAPVSYCSDPQDTCSYLRRWQRICTHLFQSQHSPQLPHAGYVGMAEAQQWEQRVCLGAEPQKAISGTLKMGNTELGARAGTQHLEMEITKTRNCAVIPVRNFIFPSSPFVSAKYYFLFLLLCSYSWDCADDGEHILKVILTCIWWRFTYSTLCCAFGDLCRSCFILVLETELPYSNM